MKLEDINWGIILPLVVIQVILMTIALVDIARRDIEAIRGPKIAWVLISIFVNMIGPILYFTIGRKSES